VLGEEFSDPYSTPRTVLLGNSSAISTALSNVRPNVNATFLTDKETQHTILLSPCQCRVWTWAPARRFAHLALFLNNNNC
jgi:hypothetical protein